MAASETPPSQCYSATLARGEHQEARRLWEKAVPAWGKWGNFLRLVIIMIGIIMIVPNNYPIILIDDHHYTYHYTRNTIPLNLANCVRRTADRFRMISLNRHGPSDVLDLSWVDRKHEVKQRKDVDQQQCSSQWSEVCNDKARLTKPGLLITYGKYSQILIIYLNGTHKKKLGSK